MPSSFAEIRSLLTDAYPGVYGEILDGLGKEAFLIALGKRLGYKLTVRERFPHSMIRALHLAMLIEWNELHGTKENSSEKAKGWQNGGISSGIESSV